MRKHTFIFALIFGSLWACQTENTNDESEAQDSTSAEEVTEKESEARDEAVLKPVVLTAPAKHDTDDPAIWINPEDATQSLIIGTDKNEDGALYVYNLKGEIQEDKVVRNLKRPNNVDIEYGLSLGGKSVDIAVAAERLTHKIRIFSLPDMKAIDAGGIEVYKGETGKEYRDLMGISLYKDPKSKEIYAIVGRKNGPKEDYLWQYLLKDNGQGQVTAELVRKFGKFSGKEEIEAIAVDDELGYIYYSDETFGVRKYYAHPDKGNEELAVFGQDGFAEDHEGISIYTSAEGKGYILVSDQQANQFHIFRREGDDGNPHQHSIIKTIKVSTNESDGSEVSSVNFGGRFSKGIFVAMSDNKTFHFYAWEDIAGEDLK